MCGTRVSQKVPESISAGAAPMPAQRLIQVPKGGNIMPTRVKCTGYQYCADSGQRGRAFLGEWSGGGTSGNLYCRIPNSTSGCVAQHRGPRLCADKMLERQEYPSPTLCHPPSGEGDKHPLPPRILWHLPSYHCSFGCMDWAVNP